MVTIFFILCDVFSAFFFVHYFSERKGSYLLGTWQQKFKKIVDWANFFWRGKPFTTLQVA
jgi:hypothetical protein